MKTKIRYLPLTATPFKCSSVYQEISPCPVLQPYVRCFWGGESCCPDTEAVEASEIVIPDICVDIIYRIDDEGYIITSDFIGINDRSFFTCSDKKSLHKLSVFAIRFYAWSAYLFSEDSLTGTVNGRYDVRERFGWLDQELRRRLPEPGSLTEWAGLAEMLLLKKLETTRKNMVLDSVVSDILRHQGALTVEQLSKENFVSSRHMERLFYEYVGITPKKLSNLVRYQCLWRDIIGQGNFNITDAVYKYGYTDASHLMREFKRYHSMGIRAAREMALQSELQDNRGRAMARAKQALEWKV